MGNVYMTSLIVRYSMSMGLKLLNSWHVGLQGQVQLKSEIILTIGIFIHCLF